MFNRVILLVDSRYYGGIESHIFHLAQLLIQHKCLVTVVFLKDYGPHPMEHMLNHANIAFVKLTGNVKGLYEFIQQHDSNTVIHAHGYKACICARLLCLKLKRKCITTFHCGDRGTGKQALYCWIDKVTSTLSINIAVSKEIATWHGGKVKIIDNFMSPLAPPQKRFSTQAAKRLAFVGRLSDEKGPDLFVELAKRCHGFHNLEFHIYGDGPLRDQLQHAATRNITFHGFCNNMTDHWHQLDGLIISSRFEGMPMVAIEAMMHGVNVIATSCGELPLLLGEGKRGWLAEKPSVDALWDALQAWLEASEVQRVRISQQGYDHVIEKCSGKTQWQQYQLLYQTI